MAEPEFWNNKDTAQKYIEEANGIRAKLDPAQELTTKIDDLEMMKELITEEEDAEAKESASRDLLKDCEAITKSLDAFELQSFLTGTHDHTNAFFTIHSGAGGTESCDWADMLYRMYSRWCERAGYKTEIVDFQAGDEVGIKSATLRVIGTSAYGYLNTERGVHRLVRISPFDSNKRRHTSFASVDVMPELPESEPITIDERDLSMDTFRSGGKGGQNVNKVETAVRITHHPSGVIVACQAERSQHKNRELAMRILMGKLMQIEEDKQRSESDRQYGEKGDVAWGSQIRSYVFQPYQMVKDHRTGVETGNVQAVMDGAIDEFIHGKLRGLKSKKGTASDDDLDEG